MRVLSVPNFVDLQVSSTIELEHVDIGDSVPASLERLDPIARARDLSARWRALKRLAEQGQHHYYTALFARNEMRAREPLDRQQRPVAALIGRWYGLLSDYGLSLWRPWAWWFASLVLFAMLYAGAAHPELVGPELVACVPGFGVMGPLQETAAEVYGLAKRTSFLAQVPVEPHVLRGDDFASPLHQLFRDGLPCWVIVAVTAQTLISGLLAFLFGLAVRNHFRVR